VTTLLLIRHATAGDPDAWVGDDRKRPVDERGRRQSKKLVDLLEQYPLDRLLTSPYLRCVQTLEPLAVARGLPLEYRDELGDEAPAADALALMRELAGSNAALSMHGDQLKEVLGEKVEKGGVVVTALAARPAVLEQLPPPA
jgi:phosphohistidine phosphatase SixA